MISILFLSCSSGDEKDLPPLKEQMRDLQEHFKKKERVFKVYGDDAPFAGFIPSETVDSNEIQDLIQEVIELAEKKGKYQPIICIGCWDEKFGLEIWTNAEKEGDNGLHFNNVRLERIHDGWGFAILNQNNTTLLYLSFMSSGVTPKRVEFFHDYGANGCDMHFYEPIDTQEKRVNADKRYYAALTFFKNEFQKI
ncbi:hypothetical protein COB64_02630 [Candidatus Wolfebacteria bacterium]|nr:MAG: hypothetical protein COB64_02630 [Candidatus Wolfebacteria bacterium]